MQTTFTEPENDKIVTITSSFHCKIMQVTDAVIIYKYRGIKQGITQRRVEYFTYGEAKK